MEQFLQNRSGIRYKALNTENRKRPYHRVTPEVISIITQEIENLVREVFERKLSINKSADKLGLKRSTAKQIIVKYKQQKKREEKARKLRQKREKLAEVPDNRVQEQIQD